MDWTNEDVMRFLELYQMHPCIWDPKNRLHKNKAKVNDAWIYIRNNMEEQCTVKELKQKKDSLMAAFRAYKTKIRRSETSGAAASEVYQPKWFAYEFMNSFLGAVYKGNPSMSTEHGIKNRYAYTRDLNTETNNEDDTKSTTETPFKQEGPSKLQKISSLQSRSLEKESTTNLKRSHNLLELQQAKNQMDQAFAILLKNISEQQQDKEENDECDLFSKLLAKKLRKLPEERRDRLIYKINNLVYEESVSHLNYNRPSSSASNAPTSPIPPQEDNTSK